MAARDGLRTPLVAASRSDGGVAAWGSVPVAKGNSAVEWCGGRSGADPSVGRAPGDPLLGSVAAARAETLVVDVRPQRAVVRGVGDRNHLGARPLRAGGRIAQQGETVARLVRVGADPSYRQSAGADPVFQPGDGADQVVETALDGRQVVVQGHDLPSLPRLRLAALMRQRVLRVTVLVGKGSAAIGGVTGVITPPCAGVRAGRTDPVGGSCPLHGRPEA